MTASEDLLRALAPQVLGVGAPNDIASGGRIEPNVVMNPSSIHVRATKLSHLVIRPPSICRRIMVRLDNS